MEKPRPPSIKQLEANRRVCQPPESHAPEMLFIVSQDLEKADAATRKLIRSHVMQGKKKRATPRKSMKVTQLHSAVMQSSPNWVFQVRVAEEVRDRYTTSIPRRVGSDLSFIEFADDIELSMLLNITKIADIALSIIFPLMNVVGFRVDQEKRLYPMQDDAAALHVSAFAIEDFIYRVLRYQNGTSYIAMLHYQKGLGILRERLLGDDEKAKTTDSTLGTILKLASAAQFNGDTKASVQHMKGVRRIVDLRGGLKAFDGRELQMEILRYDLSIALLNGSKPFFVNSEESFKEYPKELSISSDEQISSQEHLSFLSNIDDGLKATWWALKRFCSLANLGVQTSRRMRPRLIQDTMASVIYRLLHMQFAADSTDELMRIGLLAFSHHVFLQWHGIQPPPSHFSDTYRNQMMRLDLADRVPPHLMIWFLIIGKISFFPISVETWLEDALQTYIERSRLGKWKDIQDVMGSFMWIPVLHEQPVKCIIKSIRPTKPKGDQAR